MDETAKSTLQGIERKGELVFTGVKGNPVNPTVVRFAFRESVEKSNAGY
jgi:hypothetical protein